MVPPEDCWANGYRNGDGSCCNQTLSHIGLNLLPGFDTDMIGNATLTTDAGKVMPVIKARTFWGVNLYPFIEDYNNTITPSLFVTEFTVGQPWTLSVAIARAAVGTSRKWPCGPSRYLPLDDNVCDVILTGFQTVPGNADEVRNFTSYEVPGCCPEGIVRYGKDDTCCVDDIAESSYSLAFNSADNSTAGESVFSFNLQYKSLNAPNVVPPRTDCSQAQVDQLELYLGPSVASKVRYFWKL